MTAIGALLHKSWLETRVRFTTGVIATTGVAAFMTLLRPRIVAQWKRDLIEHPEWRNPVWFDDVLHNYTFYLWHYLYQDMLQKVVIIFAVLLGVGGLVREAAHGTAGFTLSLPATRTTLVLARASVGAAEVLALGIVALLTVLIGSWVVGEPYSLWHGAMHIGLIVLGGWAVLAASLAVSAIAEGEHAPALIGLSAVTLLYFIAQPYTDGETEPPLIRALNLPAIIAGGAGAGMADVRWIGVVMVSLLTVALVLFTVRRTVRRDF